MNKTVIFKSNWFTVCYKVIASFLYLVSGFRLGLIFAGTINQRLVCKKYRPFAGGGIRIAPLAGTERIEAARRQQEAVRTVYGGAEKKLRAGELAFPDDVCPELYQIDNVDGRGL